MSLDYNILCPDGIGFLSSMDAEDHPSLYVLWKTT